jgi:hypothetical protein
MKNHNKDDILKSKRCKVFKKNIIVFLLSLFKTISPSSLRPDGLIGY